MVNVLRRSIPGWHTVWTALALSFHAVLIYSIAFVVCTWPEKAFAYSGYSRVLTVSQYNAMNAARLAAQTSLVSSSVAATTGSVALRMVTGPVGWAALGISAGLTLAQIYYTQSQVQAIRSAAAPSTYQTSTSLFANTATINPCAVQYNGSNMCTASYDYWVVEPNAAPYQNAGGCVGSAHGGVPSGWDGWYALPPPNVSFSGCRAMHFANNNNNRPSLVAGTPTPTNVTQYVSSLPANDPNSIPSNTTPVGLGATPTPAGTTITDPIDPTTAQTTVVPSNSVPSGSTVVDNNATPPAGTQQNTTASQGDTSTKTVVTNPDGSTTTTTTDGATSSCTVGDHDKRTFGDILQTHIDTWKGSGILGQVALLQSLTWPSALPTITLTSGMWGNISVNFNDWANMFTALRAIVIAGAGFAAYRIIFVGGGA